jgi:hypothetical protein
MLHELDPSNDLETVRAAVGVLLARAEERGIDPGGPPWSLAELRLGADDILWLQAWGRCLDRTLLNTCIHRSWHKVNCGGRRVTLDAMIGLLLVLLAAVTARRAAVEGTLWPHVRFDDEKRLRFSAGVDSILFDQNGPSAAFKALLEAAVRAFGLRHALDDEDVCKYYRTVFLQFGFPIRDARKRLAHWLVVGVSQVACDHLLDPGDRRHSRAFCHLWESLRGYRRNNLGAETMHRRLRESPWVLPEWAEELLDLARMEIAGGESVPCGGQDDVSFLSEPRLRWPTSAAPVLVARVENLTDLGLIGSEYDVRLAGDVRARIFRAAEDQFDVEPGLDVELPLASPTLTADLVDEGGWVVRAMPITCWDPAVLATVFRLPSGVRLEAGEAPRPSGEYALLAAEDLTLEPAARWCLVPTPQSRLKLWNLSGTDVPRAALRDGQGREVWRADCPGPTSESAPIWARATSVRLEDLGVASSLLGRPVSVEIRHPAEVDMIFARCGQQPVDCLAAGPGRTTAGPIAVPPESLAYPDQSGRARTLELLVGLQYGGNVARVALKLPVLGSGAARLRGEAWVPLNGGAELDRAEGDAELFRIVPPVCWEGLKVAFDDCAVMEGNTWVGRPRPSPCPLPGLAGLGAPLTVRRGPYNSTGEAMHLAAAVVDHGLVRAFEVETSQGEQFGIQIALARPLEIDAKCKVAVWCRDGSLLWAEPRHPVQDVGVASDRWTAELPPHAASPRAVAVAFDGIRRGAWWSDDWVQGLEELGVERASELATALWWLRLPILSREPSSRIRYFAQAFSTEVLGAWTLTVDVPVSLQWSRCDEGLRSAVRTLYRDWEPDPGIFPALSDRAADDCDFGELPQVRLALALLDLSPLLMAKLLRAWLVDGRVWREDPASARALVGLIQQRVHERAVVVGPTRAKVQGLEVAWERCAELLGGVDLGFLQSLFDEAAEHVLRRTPLGGVTADNLDVAIGKVPLFRDLLALEILQKFDVRPKNRIAITHAR